MTKSELQTIIDDMVMESTIDQLFGNPVLMEDFATTVKNTDTGFLKKISDKYFEKDGKKVIENFMKSKGGELQPDGSWLFKTGRDIKNDSGALAMDMIDHAKLNDELQKKITKDLCVKYAITGAAVVVIARLVKAAVNRIKIKKEKAKEENKED